MDGIHHFPGLSVVDGDIKMDINLNRFSEQFNQAQYELDGNVAESIQRFMPKVTGQFIEITAAMNGTIQGQGMVFAGRPPMGRFLYNGLLMVDPVTGSPWARKGAKKVVTDTPLKYNQAFNPEAGPNWYPKAKAVDGEKWIEQCKRTAGGG